MTSSQIIYNSGSNDYITMQNNSFHFSGDTKSNYFDSNIIYSDEVKLSGECDDCCYTGGMVKIEHEQLLICDGKKFVPLETYRETMVVQSHKDPVEIIIPENSNISLIILNSENISIRNSNIYGNLKIYNSKQVDIGHSIFYYYGDDVAIDLSDSSDSLIHDNLITTYQYETKQEVKQTPPKGDIPMNSNLWTITNIAIVMAICLFTYKFILPKMNIKWFAKKFKEMIYKPFKKMKKEVQEEMEKE